jgi:hypothetical protein
MIEIQGRHQFKSAAARIQRERMSVRRMEAGAYFVRNVTKGHDYVVRFVRIEGKVFGGCTCEAGLPSDRGRAPLQCKHLLAAIIVHNALNAMRRAAHAAPAPIPAFDDTDDPDMMESNY